MKLCKGGFKKLLSVGSGRLETMLAAARDGAEEAPYDLRYLHRGCNAELSQKRALVHQYLTQLYNEVAEPMPDGMNSRKRPRHGELRQDPKDLDRSAIKHLPPGTFAEYHSQFEACHPGVKVSSKLFCAEWQAGFLEKLRVRKATHHTKCAQCIAHRLIIKQVGHCPPACRAQREEYDKHLKRQYMDRRTYWDVRAQSRLDPSRAAGGGRRAFDVCCILDSMDQAKHSWPRSTTMLSKTFGSFPRPRLTSTTVIVHGHAVVTALSDHLTSSNSSRLVEVLAHALTELSKTKLDVRSAHLHIQGDNCSKELKNNTLVRAGAMWTALRKVSGVSLGFLTSGHSHEDVDGLFSLMGAHIAAHKELHTPDAFQACLQEFLDKTTTRPFEAYKKVVIMNEFHDWCLGLRYYLRTPFTQEELLARALWRSDLERHWRAGRAPPLPHGALRGFRTGLLSVHLLLQQD